MAEDRLCGMFSGVSPWALLRAMFAPSDSLSAAESASDLFRFFRSKHVIDLKVIAILGSGLLIVLAWNSNWELTNAAAMLALWGAAIGWAYRSASTRLGVVDLFACEISTLCRVGTIFDSANNYISWYETKPRSNTVCQRTGLSPKFVSQEEYFPVLANNSRDLQLLQAGVVNHIIEFYTYIKGVRDQLRALAEIDPGSTEEVGACSKQDKWHTTVFNIVYSLFLGYESARKAIKDLIEFEPAAAEARIAILLTEIRCYAFLMSNIAVGDFRYERLSLRLADYKEEVMPLCGRVESHRGEKNEKDWLPALRTTPELKRRYDEEYLRAIRRAKEKHPARSPCTFQGLTDPVA